MKQNSILDKKILIISIIKLLKHSKYLTEIGKLRLTISLLKCGYLSLKIDKDKIIDLLQKFSIDIAYF